MTENKIELILKAYENNMTLESISMLFKVEQKELISLIYAFKIGKGTKKKTFKVPFYKDTK